MKNKHALVTVGIIATIAVGTMLTRVHTESTSNAYRTALLGKMPTNADPILTSEYNVLTLVSQVCGRLTSVDENLNISGDLAESWKVSSDRKTFTFKIRNSRKFDSGEPVTAQDIAFSIERAKNLATSVSASWAREIERVRTINESEVEVQLSIASTKALFTLSHPRYCILNRSRPLIKLNDFWVPNSAGAYRFARVSDYEISLAASPTFHEIVQNKIIEVRFLTQDKALNEFKNGALDDLSFYLLSMDEITSLGTKVQVFETPLFWTWMLSLNPRSNHFDTPSKRAAFFLDLDIQKISARWPAKRVVDYSVIPKGMPGFADLPFPWNKKTYAHVPFKCKKPLMLVGIDGIPSQLALAKAIEDQIKSKTNCEIESQFASMNEWIQPEFRAKFDLYVHGIDTNSLDPIGFFRDFVTGESDNTIQYVTPILSSQYRRMEMYPQEDRAQTDYLKLQASFLQEAVGVPIGHPIASFVYSHEVIETHMNPLGMHLNRWWKIRKR